MMSSHHISSILLFLQTCCLALPTMIKVTYLPVFVTRLFRGRPGVWKDRYRLSLIWLMVRIEVPLVDKSVRSIYRGL